ncbi:MAG: hypothetical protein PUB35_03535, partial [Campylobacteraceae bacterium]|nr:hypothetical protein [Campylobacteraceae bacterium]
TTNSTADANLKVGNVNDCIKVKLVDKNGNAPAHIVFTKNTTNQNSGVCKQVLASDPLKPYFDSKITYTNNNQQQTINNAMAIGSSTSVY